MTIAQAKSYLVPATLWTTAFVCALYPVNAFQLEWFTGAILILFGWMAVMLFRDIRTGWEMPRSVVLALAGAFWALVLCSVFWSEVKPVSLLSVCFFSVMPLTFFGGVMGGRDEYFKRLAIPLGVIFAVLSVWAVVQLFFLNAYFSGQARHPLGDPSSFGALFGLAFFCALGLSVSNRPSRERTAGIVLSILFLCGVFSTVSRGPLFAFIPALPVFFVLLWPDIKARYRSVLAILLGAAVFLALSPSGGNLLGRLTNTLTAENIEKTLEGRGGELRPFIWQSALDMIEDAPLLGRGAGTFFLYYPEYRNPAEIDGVYFVHSDPLQFWVELGILGPLLFYGFVVACVWRTFAALKKLPHGSNDRTIIVSVFAALIALVAHSHITFNHFNLSILMIEGLLLSVWFLATGRALAEEKRLYGMPENMPYNLDKALVVLPFVMTGWLFVSVAGGEYLANKARDALFRQDMAAFADNVNKAARVSMGLNYRTYLFAANVPLAILEDRKDTLNEDQQKKLFEQVEGYMDNVAAINPRSASVYYYMGKVQSLVPASVLPDDLMTQEECYKEALRLDPMHLAARMALFRLYQAQGKDPQEILEFMESAYTFTYNTDAVKEYYSALATLYLESGNTQKARDVLTTMAAYKKRSDYSLRRRDMTIPQAVMGGDDMLHAP